MMTPRNSNSKPNEFYFDAYTDKFGNKIECTFSKNEARLYIMCNNSVVIHGQCDNIDTVKEVFQTFAKIWDTAQDNSRSNLPLNLILPKKRTNPMATSKIVSDPKIMLELNAREAIFLKAVLQNPIHGEDRDNLMLRESLFHALPEMLELIEMSNG